MRVLAGLLLFVAAIAVADPQNVRDSLAVLKPFEAPSGGATAADAGAAKRDPQREAEFRRLDLDGDGFVTRAEAAGEFRVVQGFDRADRDNDGRLTYREYEALVKRAEALQKAREARAKKKK